jgi:hypothetical protein
MAKNAEYSKNVLFTVGIFENIEDAHSQDAVLHRIFFSLNEESIKGTLNDVRLTETILTLYRLYFNQGWEPARTFFYNMTGVLLNSESPRVSLSTALLRSLYDHTDLEVPMMDPRTIHGECDKHCDLFNSLWFDSENYYGDDEDGEKTESEEENSEDEESDDSINDEESAESVVTEEGYVDPRNLVMPQWVSEVCNTGRCPVMGLAVDEDAGNEDEEEVPESE